MPSEGGIYERVAMDKTGDPLVGPNPSAPHFQPKPRGSSEKRAKCLFSFEKYKIPEEGIGTGQGKQGDTPTHNE